jgi:epoxyqueuosine reductase
LKKAIANRARELGFDDCRITTASAPERAEKLRQWLGAGHHGEMAWVARNADKRADPQLVLPGARSVITLAVSYGAGEEVFSNQYSVIREDRTPRNDEQPTKNNEQKGIIARYARYKDYHDIIADRLKLLTHFVNEFGPPDTRSLWYVDTGPLLERELAQRAGVGFVGKHTNLISRRLGNWFFLSEIITTLEIEPDAPEPNRCGTCTRCITACPTAAITAPFELDARRCISYLTIELKGSIPLDFRPLIGNRIYGCDDCLAACPWNRFAKASSLMQAHSRPAMDAPALVELLALDDAAFKEKFAGTPMLRTKRRGILRNVCVALGNSGDASALPALERALNDHEPLIREHAAWAIEQIRGK